MDSFIDCVSGFKSHIVMVMVLTAKENNEDNRNEEEMQEQVSILHGSM